MAETPKIVIFYHCLFVIGEPPQVLPQAGVIVSHQMHQLHGSGLWDAAEDIFIGVNGADESVPIANHIIPPKPKITYHGLKSRAENLTIVLMEEWLKTHPGYYVLYFHSKSASRQPGSAHAAMADTWRECMMRNLVDRWQRCVADLDAGYESVGCHWMVPPATPPEQYIWAGNFWWAKSDFLRTLPSMMLRARIQQSGIGHADSRYEAEVWIGNGPRPPVVKDYHPNWNPSKWGECTHT